MADDDADKNEKGLYLASTLTRMALSGLPRLIWGDKPHTATARLMTWVAPAASGMLGMFMNNVMRKNAVEKNKASIDALKVEMVDIEKRLKAKA